MSSDWVNSMPAPDWLSSEADLIFRKLLPKISITGPEDVFRLAAYADCLVNLRRVRKDPKKARVWTGAAIYCRNGLGLRNAVMFISLMDLLIDSGNVGEYGLTAHLEPEWQIERPADYLTAPYNY